MLGMRSTAQYNGSRKDKAVVCLDAFRTSPPQRDCVIQHQRRLAACLPFRAFQQFAVPHAQNCSRKSLFCRTLPLTPFDLGLCADSARLTSCFQDFAKIGGRGVPPSRPRNSRTGTRGPFAIHARKRASMPAERLQKIIAAAGIASRRKAEELITAGLVSVNGQTVTELGTKADPEVDNIKINGQPLGGAQRHVYLLLNKPKRPRHHGHRPGRASNRDGPCAWCRSAHLSGGSARLPQRRSSVADERRRAGAEADPRVVACAQDLRGQDQRQACGF